MSAVSKFKRMIDEEVRALDQVSCSKSMLVDLQTWVRVEYIRKNGMSWQDMARYLLNKKLEEMGLGKMWHPPPGSSMWCLLESQGFLPGQIAKGRSYQIRKQRRTAKMGMVALVEARHRVYLEEGKGEKL